MDLLTYGFSGAVALLLIAGSLLRLTRRPAAYLHWRGLRGSRS
ncbi:hypothetical protein AB0M29_34110 [Streptomyces sp. NPDC051976]